MAGPGGITAPRLRHAVPRRRQVRRQAAQPEHAGERGRPGRHDQRLQRRQPVQRRRARSPQSTLTGLGMGTGLTLAGRTFTGRHHLRQPRGAEHRARHRQRHASRSSRRTPAARRSRAAAAATRSSSRRSPATRRSITGDGDDTVTVSNDQGLVDQITALLTLDTGAGNDTVNVATRSTRTTTSAC